MKKLTKLKLQNATVMTEAEMKMLTGGSYYQWNCASTGPTCNTGTTCVITEESNGQTTSDRIGRCQRIANYCGCVLE